MCYIAGIDSLMNMGADEYNKIKTKLLPLWRGINAVDHNIEVTKDYCKYKVLDYDYYRNDPECTIKYSETNMYINHYSWWFRNNGSIRYANQRVRDDFLKFITEYDFLQIIKDEIMQGKLQYPILEFDMYYAAVKIFMMLKKDFDNLDKLCNKPEGWEFAKSDEEYHRKKNKAKWEFEDVNYLPKPTNLPIQRDDVTVWDNRFGVIPIQQYEMDPHKIELTDEQIVAMFNALKDSFLYDYAYSEYFKEHHSDVYDKMYKYYEKYILSDPTDYHNTSSYRQAYEIVYWKWTGEYNYDHDTVIEWMDCMIEWELRRRFQPLIDRYWINGVDTLGLFSSKTNHPVQVFTSPDDLLRHVTSNAPKGIPNNPPLEPDVKPSLALVEQLYNKKMIGTDESLRALCPNAFLAHKPNTQEEYNRFVEKYITPIINAYLAAKPYRDAVASAYQSQIYNIEHDIHYSDKYKLFFKQIDRAPFGNELPEFDMKDFGETFELKDGKVAPLKQATYKIKDWCDENGKWYVLLVTDCYYQAHTNARGKQ